MPSTGDQTVDEILARAHEKVRTREWTNARELCQKALEIVDPAVDLIKTAILTELLAKCHFKRAFRSSSRKEFEQEIQIAIAHYEKANLFYEKKGSTARAIMSKARGLYAGFWVGQNPEDKRSIIDDCITLSGEATKTFEAEGEKGPLAEALTDQLTHSTEALHLDREGRLAGQHFERALEAGRLAISEFAELNDREGLLEVLHHAIRLIAVEAQSYVDPSRIDALTKEAGELAERLSKLAQETGTTYALCLAKQEAGNIAFNLDGDYSKALSLFEDVASEAGEVYDSLELGVLFGDVSSAANWQGIREDYAERRREILVKGIRYTSEAIKCLKIPYHTTSIAMAYAAQASCYTDLADFVETDLEGKRASLAKAIEIAANGAAVESGTLAWQLAAHSLSKATYLLASISENREEKIRLLKQALNTREQTLTVTDQLLPDFLWSRGVMQNYLALIKAELANLEKETANKAELLREATSHSQKCLEMCARSATNPGLSQALSRYCEWYGDTLFQLYLTTEERQSAENATKAYLEAIEYASKAGHFGPIPPIRWKIAKAFDGMGDFRMASEAFRIAAEDYRRTGEKLPGLSGTFEELATYMEAWAEIETARLHHSEEEYDLAYENYASAAKHLQATKTWNYLSKLCSARSLLEKGEALSNEEKHTASIESLTTAVNSFREAQNQLETMLTSTTDDREKQEFENGIRIARQRETYGLGRIELEEARVLDKKGEKAASSRKYQSASDAFKTLAKEIDIIRDRNEMETLAQFCWSWARMKEAESKASPELFAEAAEAFMRVKDTITNETLRLLSLANASICRALESGTRFRLTRNVQLYSEIKRQLETAADYYQEAGFKKTGSWTRATQRLFDALVLLVDAETERDLKRKTELYHVAEKHLELAARLYGEAGFPSKKQEALEHLERTREEKEVLLAPLEALAEMPTVSAAHLTSISLSRPQAPGLERFEEARLAGEVRTAQRELTLGSDLTIAIDIVNVGKTPATLIRLENIVPEGCEPATKEGLPSLRDNSIDLRGKRLEYMKTYETKVSLRATRKGTFEINPRVVFVDERGNYRSTTFQPSPLTIREPGISEGARSPSTVRVPEEFRFENERSRDAFQHLVKEFLDDYMTKRIFMEKAGWRSLMDVIRDLKIPRSAFYGPGGRTGPALAELERRGLVETRIFPKERGRGGEIKRVRVAYENSVVKRIVEKAVMENT